MSEKLTSGKNLKNSASKKFLVARERESYTDRETDREIFKILTK